MEEEALKYFGLDKNFSESDLVVAYARKKKDDKKDYYYTLLTKKFNHQKDRGYFAYDEFIKYKACIIDKIDKDIYTNVYFSGYLTNRMYCINDLPLLSQVFYADSNFDVIFFNLKNNLKINYDIFINVDLEKASTKEEVDASFQKFKGNTFEEFNNFYVELLKSVNIDKSLVDSSGLDTSSLKGFLTSVYDVIYKYRESMQEEENDFVNKEKMIHTFVQEVNDLEGEDRKKAFGYVLKLFELIYKDDNSFSDTYNEALEYFKIKDKNKQR